MIDITEVQTAVVTSLQDIATLVSQLGSAADSIYGYDPDNDLTRTAAQAIAAMPENSLLVIFDGMAQVTNGAGGFQRWGYSFTVSMQFEADITAGAPGTYPGYFGVIKNIIDGTVGSTGLRWYDSQIHPAFDPPSDPRFERVLMEKTEFWQLTFSLIEIGG